MLRSFARALPLLALSLAVLPSASAQRRFADGTGRTDLQLLATGLDVDGVGLRFWVQPQGAIAVQARLDYASTSNDVAPDVSRLGLGLDVAYQYHSLNRGFAHPYFSLGALVDHVRTDQGTAESTRTSFGGRAALGAEAQLVRGLSLSGEYGFEGRVVSGDNGSVESDGFQLSLGGTPRLALSLRF